MNALPGTRSLLIVSFIATLLVVVQVILITHGA